MTSTRVTRSANTTTFSWVYVGTGSKDMQSVQNGKCEDVLMYDMDIITPDGKLKKNRSFFLKSVAGVMVYGYYLHQGIRVNMKVTAGHVMMGPDALEKKNRKRRASPEKKQKTSCESGSRRTRKKKQKTSCESAQYKKTHTHRH